MPDDPSRPCSARVADIDADEVLKTRGLLMQMYLALGKRDEANRLRDAPAAHAQELEKALEMHDRGACGWQGAQDDRNKGV